MRVPKVPKECATVLAEIYGKEFGGQDGGAYRIGRDALKNITGRPMYHQTLIEDIADWLIEYGLILIDRDEYFVIMRPTVLDAIRETSSDVLAAYHHPVSFGGPYDD